MAKNRKAKKVIYINEEKMTNVIEVKNLRKDYKHKTVVKNVNLTIKRGEIFGVLGPNGAGKTTTLEIIEGLRSRNSGTVSVLGLDPAKHAKALYKRIGIQLQNTSLKDELKLREALELFASFHQNNTNIAKLIKDLALEPFLETEFKDLSGGCKQRLMIALANIHNPEIIFLDEPSTGLDPYAKNDLWAFIKRLKSEGKTVLLTTHDMAEARNLCDRIAFFHQGNILDVDTPQKLAAKYTAQSFIDIEVSGADIASLQALPSINSVETDGNKYKLYGPSLEKISLELFQLINERSWSVTQFAFATGSLEDLFISLVREEDQHERTATC